MTDKNWPAWRYGPGGKSDVFQHESDVPNGWVDHPSKVVEAPKTTPAATPKTPAPAATKTPAPAPAAAAGTDVDAHGHSWDPKLHAATKTKTKEGLWRMGVGKSRPEPLPGFPKPVLDL